VINMPDEATEQYLGKGKGRKHDIITGKNLKKIVEEQIGTYAVNGWQVVEKGGTIRKAEKRDGLLKVEPIEGGCSSEDGIPVRPVLNGRLRKRAKRNKK